MTKKPSKIKLKCGVVVVVDWSSLKKCRCGKEIFMAVTVNMKIMPIVPIARGVFDTHFADCPFADDYRKRKKK